MYMGYSYLYMCICTGIKNFNIFNFMHIYERPIHTKNDTVTLFIYPVHVHMYEEADAFIYNHRYHC